MRKPWFAGLLMAVLVPGLMLGVALSVNAQPPEVANRPLLGILLTEPPEDAKQAGALVAAVTPESPAAKAGLQKGDLITKVGDKEIKAPQALVETIASHKPGAKVTIQFVRDGKEQEVTVTLGKQRVPQVPDMPEFLGGASPFLGVQAQELTAELKKERGLEVEKGVLVADVLQGSPADKAGLEEGDVITEVDGKAVANYEELRTAIQKKKPGQEVTLKVLRGKETKELKAKLGAARPQFGSLPGFGREGSFPFSFENFPEFKDFNFEDFPEFKQFRDLKEFKEFRNFDPGRHFEEMQRRMEEMQKKFQELKQKQEKAPALKA